ncbi:MAG TPA: molybdopterin oxidoreductase [Mycobacteriales bacterium]|nr:molybdopterin oxidoreductase [Mycobacteriales bacterium]
MTSTPRFLQGIVPFEGHGQQKPVPLDPAPRCEVPSGVRAQTGYFRGSGSSGDLVCVVPARDGVPMRCLPVGARGAVHVSPRVVHDLDAGTVAEPQLAGPEGVPGTAVHDVGLVEV